MPKPATKKSVSKTALIREFKAANPNIGPSEIARTLTKQHKVEITANYVSTILNKAKNKPNKASKRGRKPANQSSAGAMDLLSFSQTVKEMGGIEACKDALNSLETIQQNL